MLTCGVLRAAGGAARGGGGRRLLRGRLRGQRRLRRRRGDRTVGVLVLLHPEPSVEALHEENTTFTGDWNGTRLI